MQILLKSQHPFTIETFQFQFFCCTVNRLHRRCNGELCFRNKFQFRVNDVYRSIELRWFSKQYILSIELEIGRDPLNSLEPTQLKKAGLIFKTATKVLSSFLASDNEACYYSFYLDIRQIGICFPDGIELGTVDIPKRVMMQKIALSIDPKFFL